MGSAATKEKAVPPKQPAGDLVSLKLDRIELDSRLQTRASMDHNAVEEYAEAIKQGREREGQPPRVYKGTGPDGETMHWLADGWHWWYASKKAGKSSMLCYVVPGTFLDALVYAAGANTAHGLKRTAEDKRRAILACLENEELVKKSDRIIADMCHVSHELVGKVRASFDQVMGELLGKRTDKRGREQPATKKKKTTTAATQPVATAVAPVDVPPIDPAPDLDNEPATSTVDVFDAKERTIPEELQPVFDKTTFFRSQIGELGKVLAAMKQFAESKDPAGAFINLQSLEIAHQNYLAAISSARPYIVCPTCHGTKKEAGLDDAPECKLCRSFGKPQGWLPAGKWNALTHELKEIAQAEGKAAGRIKTAEVDLS